VIRSVGASANAIRHDCIPTKSTLQRLDCVIVAANVIRKSRRRYTCAIDLSYRNDQIARGCIYNSSGGFA
jgi:hypothetical protein